jgi:hypothetical protein
LRDPVLALDFDLAAAARLLEVERAALAAAGLNPDAALNGAAPTRHVRW